MPRTGRPPARHSPVTLDTRPPSSTTAADARRGLLRMQALAGGLLAAAGLLYVLAHVMSPRHAAWGYVGAFAEAAMIGAIADWFAVVALFRHPLGLPIPHTAIIPRNKNRIGENLASFICSHFLGTKEVLAKVEAFDAAGRLAQWLAEPRHSEMLAVQLGRALRYGAGLLDDEGVRSRLRVALLEQLGTLEATPRIGRLLEVLSADGRHQPLFDRALLQLARLLDDETLREQVRVAIASQVKPLRLVGLDQAAAGYATEKLMAALVNLFTEMAADRSHALRQRIDAFVAETLRSMQDDTELRARGAELQRELLAHPALAAWLERSWSAAIAWVQRDLAGQPSLLQHRIERSARGLGRALAADAPMRAWINAQLVEVAPRWIERYREDIRQFIIARVRQWNADEMTQELERNIGRDLQFIRVNGTLVGGLVGLTLHTLTRWFG